MSAGRTLRVFTYDGDPNGKMLAPSRGYLCVDYGTPPSVYQAQAQGKTHWSKLGGVTTVSSPDGSVHITTPTTTPKLEIRIAKKAVTETTTPATGETIIWTGTAGLWVPKSIYTELVAGTNITIVKTGEKAKISASGLVLGGQVAKFTGSAVQVRGRDTELAPAHLLLTAGTHYLVSGQVVFRTTSSTNAQGMKAAIGISATATGVLHTVLGFSVVAATRRATATIAPFPLVGTATYPYLGLRATCATTSGTTVPAVYMVANATTSDTTNGFGTYLSAAVA